MTPSHSLLRSRPSGTLVLLAACLVLILPSALPAQPTPGRVEGRILNGTTKRPVANEEVRMLSPRQQMQQVSTASSDASGHFAFNASEIDPSGFYLLETTYQGARYHAPVRFDSGGSATANFTVYDSTTSAAELRVKLLRVLVRVDSGRAQVREQYEIQNSTQPPRSYADPKGTFRFKLSPDAGKPSVSVTGLLDMPLPQEAEAGKSPGEFFIRYALKPGTTEVTVDYQADYSTAKLALAEQVSYPIDHAEMYLFPASIAVDSAVLKVAGVDSKNSIQKLAADNLPGGTALEATLSGEATAPPSAGSAAPEQGGAGESGEEVKIVPEELTRLALPLLGCFLLVLLWALGVRIAKEWPRLKARAAAPAPSQLGQKRLSAKAEKLLNSLADLDELFAAGKVAEKDYWKERLELKARLAENLKKSASPSHESYASRRGQR
ncbi:MAG TPA: carboxypeptidase-like regulatory domain-containing protein [Terriglobia bacterium]|nr:carboxypeptidase-like regulatory domain-containing protein [Terriglobia bacterium]